MGNLYHTQLGQPPIPYTTKKILYWLEFFERELEEESFAVPPSSYSPIAGTQQDIQGIKKQSIRLL